MDRPLEDSTGYLKARLAECQHRPELHRHTIEAYQRELALAQSCASGEEYVQKVQAGDQMFGIARGEQLDRDANLMAIDRALGAARTLAAQERSYRAAEAARSHTELHQAMTAVTPQVTAERQAAGGAAGHVRSLFCALLDWANAAGTSKQAGRATALQTEWQMLQQQDPQVTWDKLCTYPPYRQRIPLDDNRLAQLGHWFREALG